MQRQSQRHFSVCKPLLQAGLVRESALIITDRDTADSWMWQTALSFFCGLPISTLLQNLVLMDPNVTDNWLQ